ncbi:sugar ABC transporter substrate-binding protein [bacterium]|nr:MAG: sugar ABC transporter substrate-binding protein [bacterium]
MRNRARCRHHRRSAAGPGRRRGERITLYSRKRIVLALALAVLGGCSSQGSDSASSGSQASAGAGAGSKVIGVSIQDREAQFYQSMEAGMREAAKRYGYTLHVVDANRDNSKQQSQVEDFISQKVDAIILTPYDSTAIGSAIVEANNAKIPVFTADIASTSKQGTVVAHIASNNVQGGMEAGSLMCQALKGESAPTVAIIDEPEVTSVQDRVKGFKEELAKTCPSVKVVADVTAGGQRTKASSVADDLLQRHPNLSGIFGINDDSALGAMKSVEAAGKAGKVAIVGYDATVEARTAIKAGTMYGDAIQHPDQIGSLTIGAIHDYFNGKTPSPVIAVPVGTYTKADAK